MITVVGGNTVLTKLANGYWLTTIDGKYFSSTTYLTDALAHHDEAVLFVKRLKEREVLLW